MRIDIFVLVVLLLFMIAFTVNAEIPVLETGVYIMNGSQNLDVGYDAAPEVCDWDNDGKKDLILGRWDNGNILFYQNKGTNSSPSFNGYELIQAAGSAIQLPYS